MITTQQRLKRPYVDNNTYKDEFKLFRNMCSTKLGLYPDTFYSLPSLGFCAAQYITEMEVETLKNLEQVDFVKAGRNQQFFYSSIIHYIDLGIRGGLSQVNTKFFSTGYENGIPPEKNENPNFPHQEYEELVKSKNGMKPHIIYLDARYR